MSLLESLEPQLEKEVKEARIEGLNRGAVASLNSIGLVDKKESQIEIRRRIEVLQFEKLEECSKYMEFPEPSKVEERQTEIDDHFEKSIALQFDSKDNQEHESNKELAHSLEKLEEPSPRISVELPHGPIFYEDEFQVKTPLTKRRPTRVPHSPLRHLKLITKLIKKN